MSSFDTCKNFDLAKHFKWIYGEHENVDNVFFDIYGCCHTRFYMDNRMFRYLAPGEPVTLEEGMRLAQKVLDVLQPHIKLGIDKCLPIKSGEDKLGMTLSWKKDTVFIQCSGVRHPFDVVSTTIHEVAHHMTLYADHRCSIAGGHCDVWTRAVKYLTSLFARLNKSSPYFSHLAYLYGHDWAEYLVQSITSCAGCTGPTIKDEGEEEYIALYTSRQLMQMFETRMEKHLNQHNRDDAVYIEDDENDMNEEDVIIISDDEEDEGWEVCLPEVEMDEEEIDIETVDVEEEGWEIWLWEDGWEDGVKKHEKKNNRKTSKKFPCLPNW